MQIRRMEIGKLGYSKATSMEFPYFFSWCLVLPIDTGKTLIHVHQNVCTYILSVAHTEIDLKLLVNFISAPILQPHHCFQVAPCLKIMLYASVELWRYFVHRFKWPNLMWCYFSSLVVRRQGRMCTVEAVMAEVKQDSALNPVEFIIAEKKHPNNYSTDLLWLGEIGPLFGFHSKHGLGGMSEVCYFYAFNVSPPVARRTYPWHQEGLQTLQKNGRGGICFAIFILIKQSAELEPNKKAMRLAEISTLIRILQLVKKLSLAYQPTIVSQVSMGGIEHHLTCFNFFWRITLLSTAYCLLCCPQQQTFFFSGSACHLHPHLYLNPVAFLLFKPCSWREGQFWGSGGWVFWSEDVDCRMRSHPLSCCR
ncbi:hypothetical protein VP01_1916g2 [Puccinia sorghi]|uniref:Uncharacterized protein n=1 Tax=Puccinia sorghi TaxID=27349 RepID=A0A0L6VEI7_9BASI|nr:hypothetical protein VP01_1916g2 [Puccinia sorghi]